MNIKFLAKTGAILGSLLIGIFLLFLILPFFLNIFIDKYTPAIVGELNKISGLSSGIEEIKIVTSPKLSAGVKVKKFELYTVKKEHILTADNFEIKMSLLPLLAKKIRIDSLRLDSADVTLKYNKDGDLDFLQYIPVQDENSEDKDIKSEPNYLPFGLKLSNHLPDLRVGEYKVTITDGVDNYTITGGKTEITDFILNRSIKIKGSGKIVLKDREQFRYNVNLFNKIMPDLELNELVFNPQPVDEKDKVQTKIDVISILKGLYEYKVKASADIDLKTVKDNINGDVKFANVSIIGLPDSKAELKFSGNTITADSDIYTAKDEVSNINGKVVTGKKPYIDINLKSDLESANLLMIIKDIAKTFNIKDLQTITASGKINADFNIKSDLKTVQSNGYLKIPSAKLYYGMYNIGVDNINADVLLDNNTVNIKNISFSVLGQPLKLYGTITPDAVADIHAIADKLSVKGLLVAIGQASLMKENPVYSGTLSMDALIKGKLDSINPVIKLNIDNLNLKNIPSDLKLIAPSTIVNITSDGKTFSGTASASNVKLVNPAATVSAPNINADILPEQITIKQTPVSIEKIKTNISGKITDYLTEKIGMDFVSTGDIKSTFKGDMNVAKQTLNLVFSTTELSTVVIPMFDKSKLSFSGNVHITGPMVNPVLSGSISVPDVSVPEIPVTMSGMDIKLNGTILHGTADVKEFSSGGIKAQNLNSDFELKGNDFYLKNLTGNAFKGKINGDIVYNLINAKTKVKFKGTGMDAESAIEGGSGIKNALSGTLNFDTALTLTVLEYSDMIKSMKGDLSFDIKKGAFGTIGRFEGFLGAANITQNYLLKNTISTLSNAAGLATTAQFDVLEGKMTFSDGWATLSPVKSTGQSLCYYITGKYNIINASTNAVILGRLDAPMVAKLGKLGTLDLSSILGDKAAAVVKIITSNPAEEKTELIPQLSNGSQNYQDFKVTFNGGVDSQNSVKSFKWLKNADMSNYEKQTVKDVVKNVKDAYQTDIKTTKEEINNTIQTKKQEINDVKQQFTTTRDDFKNLWKSIKDTSKSASSQSETSETNKTTTSQESTEQQNISVEESASEQKTETEAGVSE